MINLNFVLSMTATKHLRFFGVGKTDCNKSIFTLKRHTGINNEKGGAIYPRMIRACGEISRLECKQRMYIDALTTCPQKLLAVKSTPMVMYAIMQNHPRIKSIRWIQAR